MESNSENDGFEELDDKDVEALRHTMSNRVLDSKAAKNRARRKQYRLGAKLISKYGDLETLPPGQRLRHDNVEFDVSHLPIVTDIDID